MKDRLFHELKTAKSEAKMLARSFKCELFIVKTFDGDGRYVLTDKMPMMGEWYHVYPDDFPTIRRG